jgi:hypothetical protein
MAARAIRGGPPVGGIAARVAVTGRLRDWIFEGVAVRVGACTLSLNRFRWIMARAALGLVAVRMPE